MLSHLRVNRTGSRTSSTWKADVADEDQNHLVKISRLSFEKEIWGQRLDPKGGSFVH